jgi:hypothetical protein
MIPNLIYKVNGFVFYLKLLFFFFFVLEFFGSLLFYLKLYMSHIMGILRIKSLYLVLFASNSKLTFLLFIFEKKKKINGSLDDDMPN